MRWLAVLVLLVSPLARADEEDDAYVAMPKRSAGVAVIGHATRIAGRSEGGWGPALELGLGRGRWQVLVEGMIASASLTDTHMQGRMLRGGGGVRWLARQLRDSDKIAGVEMFLQAIGGVERYYFDDGARVLRPDLALGFGMQARIFERPRLVFRFDFSVLLTPNEDTGFMGGTAFAW